MSEQNSVNVGKIPGEIFKLPYRKNESVASLLKRAEIAVNCGDIQLDGEEVTTSVKVTPGATVLVINKIKGNN